MLEYVVLSIFILFNLFYFIARLKNDFSIIDTAWSLSFLLIYLVTFCSAPIAPNLRVQIIGALVAIWALRLSGYIFLRSMKLGKEDYRYTEMRKGWGDKANISAYFKVFMLQATLSLIIASPLYFIHQFPSAKPFGTAFDYLGVAMWGIGFFFEAVGDHQKSAFKKNPENNNKVLTSGLWRYTRHPNYFGEALLWWGLGFVALSQIPFYYAFVGPFLLHLLLLKVSGVALLEQKYNGNTDYDEYKRKTNAFIPWFPRNN